jgi:hypothetical protein
MEQLANAGWRKASYSGSANNGACVEAGQAADTILVRDTTDRTGFTLPVAPASWTRFLGRVKNGNFSL